MKRTLLILTFLLSLWSTAWAASATWTADTYAASHSWVDKSTTVGKTDIAIDSDITFNITSYSTTAPKYYSPAIRVYKGSTIKFKSASGGKITKIEIGCTSSSYAKAPAGASTGSCSASGTTITWTGSASEIDINTNASTATYIKTITVTYTSGSGSGGSSGGSSDTYPALYLRGTVNSWGTTASWKLSTTDGVTYTLKSVTLPAMSEFKIADADWGANFGGCTCIGNNKEVTLYQGGDNCTLESSVKSATITFNKNKGTFKISGTVTAGGSYPVSRTSTDGWPANYKGVMLQGFYWDSYADTQWSYLEKQADNISKFFSLIWLPQSARPASNPGMGYDPVYWFTHYDSSFGTEAQLRSMIKTYKAKGVGMIADVVVNHRSGQSNWTDFPSETWDGVTYKLDAAHICSNDEVNWASGQPKPTGNADTGDNFDGSRDLDHTNALVQSHIKAYCRYLLEDLGYAGFRYDMVKGYSGYYNKLYNEYANPKFSVGEYWDSYDACAAWIENTGRKSAAFDFPLKFALNEAFSSGNLTKLVGYGQPTGLINGTYRQYSVTFVDNHDTYRDGSRFNGNVMAANAFILCSPGTPCVFMPHWLQYKEEIARLIKVRNTCGVKNTSWVNVLQSSNNCYMAEVEGTTGNLVVKIGSAMVSPSGYSDSDIVASGYDYCVWTKVKVPNTTVQYYYPDEVYLVGNADNNNWNISAPIAPSSLKDGIATWENVSVGTAWGQDYGQISIVSTKAKTNDESGWNTVNSANRYGAAYGSESLSTKGSIVTYAGNANAASCQAWQVKPGNYNIVADFKAMTITLSPADKDVATAWFKAPDYTGVDGVKLKNGTSGNLQNVPYAATDASGKSLVTFEFTASGSSKSKAYGTDVRWYKNGVLTLTPAKGYKITKVVTECTSTSYDGPFTASKGTVTASGTTLTWEGDVAQALKFTASAAIRFTYMRVTLKATTENLNDVSSTLYFEPVTSASDIEIGKRYILVASSAGKAMGKTLSKGTSGYLNSVNVNVKGSGAISVNTDDVMVLTLTKGSNASSYALSFQEDGNTYYLAIPSSSTTVSRTSTLSTSNNVVITPSSSNTTLLYSKNNRRLNYGTANSGCFQSYAASTASKVRLYKESSSSNKAQNTTTFTNVTFVADGIEGIEGTKIANTDAGNLAGQPITAISSSGNPLVKFEIANKGTKPKVEDGLVRWYKNATVTLTPAPGYAIAQVEVDNVSTTYPGPYTASEGEVDAGEGTLDWSGYCTDELVLTASEQLRFAYMIVSLIPEETIEELDLPESFSIYLDNSADWSGDIYSSVWPASPATLWPGNVMTLDPATGLWGYTFVSAVRPARVQFNHGDRSDATEAFEFVNGNIYCNLETEGVNEFYLLGDFNGWDYVESYRFNSDNGIDYALSVADIPAASEFRISTRNAALSYGGAQLTEEDAWVNLNEGSPEVCAFVNPVKNGVLHLNIDSNSMMLTSGNDVSGLVGISADSNVEPIYYNLTGVRIHGKPTAGLYIVVRGNKVTKELIK